MKEWLPFLDQGEPAIRMCVGNSSKEPLSMEVDAHINDWCLSHGFDYVDMDEVTDTPMDKVGMELALEILQTNFWEGMVKKNTNGTAEDEDLLREIQELKLQQNKDILNFSDDEESLGNHFGSIFRLYKLTFDHIDMPTHSEIDKMRNDLFSEIDDENGLDKAFEAIQSMRGEEFV